ncbi:hypothetical protein B0H10DRAFT_2165671 [Mycena sp. CBHHK59/15]|nr:hypothetical protein B0H10DRAFT_2165671 [Mycena sp. CBHHK59/15]
MVDDLILRSNVKGCTCKDGSCSAQFPRNVFANMEVDLLDGSINVKKLEPMINNVTPALTYSLRCNTDITSLLSGTSIKAVVAYISDYVTKASLKTYYIFQSNTVSLGRTGKTRQINAHQLIMKMVNALTSRLQIGSPMASMFLLGPPDLYTNFKFKVFWWRSYVSEVQQSWPSEENLVDNLPNDQSDHIVVTKAPEGYVGSCNVDDYAHHPLVLEDFSLYIYFQMYEQKKRTPTQLAAFLNSTTDKPGMQIVEPASTVYENKPESEVGLMQHEDLSEKTSTTTYMCKPDHPLYHTHYIKCDKKHLDNTVPNFGGGQLPRVDQGDHEFYCCTMLTLFKMWRSGQCLKGQLNSWDGAFTGCQFDQKATKMMKNFNICYACNDAHNDYYAQDKIKGS